jgi:hypothetical protein
MIERKSMPKILGHDEPYAGRRKDVTPMNITMEREARELAYRYSGGKTVGRFISRLVYEHHARVQTRHDIAEELMVGTR